MNKKNQIWLAVVTLFTALWTTSYATNIVDIDSVVSGDDQYITSYEEYENLLNDTVSESGYTQEQLKEYYKEYQTYIEDYYKEYERDKTIRARVIDTEPVTEEYEYNDYYYSVSKYEIQPITVKILEGDCKNQEFEIAYLLTGDSLNNVRYSELKTGDIVFVSIIENAETGELEADITNTGSNIERFGIVICIGIIALLLLSIYGGKKGVITALITLLILDFCLVIIPNMGYLGEGFVFGGIALILLLIASISILELGLNIKAARASVISIIVNIAAFILMSVAMYLTRTVGITFEVAAISENILLGNMNFESLYIIITMMIASLAITNVICKVISKLSEEKVEGFSEQLNICKSILGPNVLMIVIALLALYIPNHLLLLTNKYTIAEIWNSEILVTELIRLFVIIISMSLAVPTTIVFNEKEN